jgi:hypothetical protein
MLMNDKSEDAELQLHSASFKTYMVAWTFFFAFAVLHSLFVGSHSDVARKLALMIVAEN